MSRLRRTSLRTASFAAAWAAIGSGALWSINALADGIERRPRPQIHAEEPPEYPALLGGPEDPQPQPPVEVVKVETTPQVRDCITFEQVQEVLAKLNPASVEDVDAFIRDLQLQLGDDEYCGGVRDTIKTVFEPPAPPPPPPEPPGQPPSPPPPPPPVPPGEPPGGPGGPGYLG